ncbi:MAG: hypothetical protein ACPKM0_10660 [Pleomorphochaeta sp.]
MKKRFITLLALLVLLPVMAFATEVVITWEWMLDDPQITGFRYQLDGEDPDNWTVVDGMTSSCVIQNLDGSKEYTLYLQQTYDGVNWSPSAISIAMPLYASETVEAVDELVEADDTVVVAEAETETVGEVAADSEMVSEELVEADVEEVKVAKVKTPSDYYTGISLRGTAGYTMTEISGVSTNYDQYSIAAGLGLGFNNILSVKNVGFGLNIDTDLLVLPHAGHAKDSLLSVFTDTSITDYSLRVTLAPEMQLNFKKAEIELAPFVDAILVDYPYIGSADLEADYFGHLSIGYGAQLGFNYNVTDLLQFGLTAKARHNSDILDWDNLDYWGVEVTPAITFTL